MANALARKILIIDDTEANRYSVGRILTHAGYEVLASASIADGVETIARFKPELLILDVKLQDGNGFALCAKLKSDPATGSIPILMTSASFIAGRDRAFGLESGADGYLTTPYDPVEMLATVRALLRVRDAEEKLRKSQEIFRTMADSVPTLVWMAGADKLSYYFNKMWLDFTGRTPDQEAGNGWAEGVHPEDLERCMNVYFTSFEKRSPFETTCRLRRHDGKYRWILNRGEPHYNLDGSFAGYTGACIDIHDKLIAEQRLQESEERFDLAMKGMNDGIWDWNLASGEIYYSLRYKAMLGYGDAEFPNTTEAWQDHLHPEDRQKATDTKQKYMEGALKGYKNIYRMRHKNGEYRWILSRARAVRNPEGKPYRLVGAHTDITEQKELEKELRQASEKADMANRAKTEFLANMSHEIRTPMNAIIGLTHVLGATPLTEKQKECVGTLKLSADSMMSLINDMLDIAKIEDNMIQLESISFSLREVVDHVITMMQVKADEKDLKLEVTYADNVGDSFLGDPLRIRQILVNLISNAIKFTPKGKVTITIDEQGAGIAGAVKLSFKIADTGIGITQEKLYSIFDKFTQVDTSITRKYGGTGLGLAISRAFVEAMEGNIHVASTPGKGSVFTVNIRLKVAQAKYKKAPADSHADVKPQSIDNQDKYVLLVEDYQANIMVATYLLEELGYRYDIAMSGREAIGKIKSTPYSAVLMDVQMHEMDGYETTRCVRQWEKSEGAKPVPIIAMTAHALIGDREKCLAAGMNDYISKPFNPKELEAKLAGNISPKPKIA